MTSFAEFGNPGRWVKSVLVSGSEGPGPGSGSVAILDATGSSYGASALLLTGNIPATGSVLLSGGGEIDLQYLTTGELYEFSIERLSITGSAYVLFRNHIGVI